MNFVDYKLKKIVDKKEEIIVIGQSMGGVVGNSLHTKGWNIKLSISIGSPLHGAYLLRQFDNILPKMIRDYFYNKKPRVYDYLTTKESTEEPYHSISMAWPFTDVFIRVRQ